MTRLAVGRAEDPHAGIQKHLGKVIQFDGDHPHLFLAKQAAGTLSSQVPTLLQGFHRHWDLAAPEEGAQDPGPEASAASPLQLRL
jgi:hypothetical protein